MVRPVAADTGGAIVGEVRADLFWGTGDAGELAGHMKQPGRLWLGPKRRAAARLLKTSGGAPTHRPGRLANATASARHRRPASTAGRRLLAANHSSDE